MKKLILFSLLLAVFVSARAKTLVVYYSYTNNVDRIVSALTSQIEADVVRVEPAEKGLDYAADNYAIGSAQISAIRANPSDAASYPAIDPTDVNVADYDCIIIGAPLWWSNMAAPLQTFLFHHGKEMAGKKIGLIVSSASSGIGGVESDARRLVPDGDFLAPSLWIRSGETSNAATLVSRWLTAIGYDGLTDLRTIEGGAADASLGVFSLSGRPVAAGSLPAGVYIVRSVSGGNVRSKKILVR